ncbi:uncharacterized protein LOC124447193 isoform X2 [Xenia sp. Carnegie-2017]|uniref:uncharacterized protein LOC124447193 isoform X2 n=1 Tax=Xenia sp. Carnegie-2017 TaxID=2897299 RepID=UPI001F037CF2|nr:uncharacterized protein LOC124447193 isoform X2 [Xenia sp. Carnegie-2017]
MDESRMDDSRRIFLNNEDNKEMLQGRINEVTKSPSYDELEKFQYTETSSKLDSGNQSNLSFRPISPENGEEKNDKTVSTNAIGELRIPSNKLLGADKSLKDFGHGTLTNNVDEIRSYQTQNETFQISQQEQVETSNTPLIEQEFKRDFQDKVSQKQVNMRYQSDPFQLHYDHFHAPISTQSYEHIARCAVKPYKTRIYELKQFQTQSVYHATVKTNVREKPSNLKPNENNTNSKVQVDENIDEPELTMKEEIEKKHADDSETIPITENNTFIDCPSNNQLQKKNEEFGRPQNDVSSTYDEDEQLYQTIEVILIDEITPTKKKQKSKKHHKKTINKLPCKDVAIQTQPYEDDADQIKTNDENDSMYQQRPSINSSTAGTNDEIYENLTPRFDVMDFVEEDERLRAYTSQSEAPPSKRHRESLPESSTHPSIIMEDEKEDSLVDPSVNEANMVSIINQPHEITYFTLKEENQRKVDEIIPPSYIGVVVEHVPELERQSTVKDKLNETENEKVTTTFCSKNVVKLRVGRVKEVEPYGSETYFPSTIKEETMEEINDAERCEAKNVEVEESISDLKNESLISNEKDSMMLNDFNNNNESIDLENAPVVDATFSVVPTKTEKEIMTVRLGNKNYVRLRIGERNRENSHEPTKDGERNKLSTINVDVHEDDREYCKHESSGEMPKKKVTTPEIIINKTIDENNDVEKMEIINHASSEGRAEQKISSEDINAQSQLNTNNMDYMKPLSINNEESLFNGQKDQQIETEDNNPAVLYHEPWSPTMSNIQDHCNTILSSDDVQTTATQLKEAPNSRKHEQDTWLINTDISDSESAQITSTVEETDASADIRGNQSKVVGTSSQNNVLENNECNEKDEIFQSKDESKYFDTTKLDEKSGKNLSLNSTNEIAEDINGSNANITESREGSLEDMLSSSGSLDSNSNKYDAIEVKILPWIKIRKKRSFQQRLSLKKDKKNGVVRRYSLRYNKDDKLLLLPLPHKIFMENQNDAGMIYKKAIIPWMEVHSSTGDKRYLPWIELTHQNHDKDLIIMLKISYEMIVKASVKGTSNEDIQVYIPWTDAVQYWKETDQIAPSSLLQKKEIANIALNFQNERNKTANSFTKVLIFRSRDLSCLVNAHHVKLRLFNPR